MIQDLIIDVPSTYIMEDVISSGSHGSIYLYKNKITNELYAAKVAKNDSMTADDQKIFFSEIMALSKARNAAVLKMIGFNLRDYKNNPKPTIIMQYMSKGSLNDLLKNYTDISDTQKYIIILGIAEGMKHLNSLKIVHRDLKPENILLDDNYYPYISDFGVSKISDKNNINEILMKTPAGTPLYMAPDIFSSGLYNYKSDVYSFSFIAYQLITGELPYIGKKILDPIQLFMKIQNGERPDTSMIKEDNIKGFLENCWSSDPEKRPSFEEIIRIIKHKSFRQSMNVNDNEVSKYLELFGDTLEDDEINDSKYVDDLEKKANEGDLESILKYANILREGKIVPMQLDKAEHYYKIAAEKKSDIGIYNYAQLLLKKCDFSNLERSEIDSLIKSSADDGDSNSMLIYANILFNEESSEEKINQAVYYFQNSTNQGNLLATYIFAEILYEGDKIERDFVESARLFKIAADNGNSSAMYKYGCMLFNGEGVDLSLEESFKYIKQAADKENLLAIIKIASMFYNGEGVNSNKFRASRYWKIAADKGDIGSMKKYAEMLRKGDDIVIDTHESLKYYEKAADKGDIESMKKYCEYIYSDQHFQDKKLHYCKMLADNGDTRYMIKYSILIYKSSKAESENYLKNAAENGNVVAMYHYSFVLLNGYYGKVNQQLSNYYSNIANSKEDTDAMCEYADLLLFLKRFIHDYPKSIDQISKCADYYKMAADKGNDLGSYHYARYLLYYKNDTKEACSIFKNLSDKGYENAMYEYANLIQSSDEEEAFRLFKILTYKDCESSFLAACEYIEYLLRKNYPDLNVEALQLAIKFNHTSLMNFQSLTDLGDALYFGKDGYEINKKLAVDCYIKSALRGNVLSMYLYATMLNNGDNVQKDEMKATYLFEKADSIKSSSIMYEYAQRLYDGKGIKADKKTAAKYIKESALLGDKMAMYRYANMLYDGEEFEVDKKEAAKYYEKVVLSGNEDAMIKYTNMLLEGDGIDQDKKKAASILKTYADYNSIYAIDKYSNMLLNGDGIDSDPNEANKYLEKKKNHLNNHQFPKKEWFKVIFGFAENVNHINHYIQIAEYDDHLELKSTINNQIYNAGNFHIRSSSRNNYKLNKKNKQGTLNIIKGYGQYTKHFELIDILSIQSLPKWNGATYLIASNFNCLEFINPNQSGICGITNYYLNNSQGSNAALACCPAAFYRNYFIKQHDCVGQLTKEVNLLEKTPIFVSHGFAMIRDDKYFQKSSYAFNWDNPNIWQVGVHSNCEVVLTRGNDSTYRKAPQNQFANHVYASAFNFRNNVKSSYLTKKIAKKLLIAEYRAAIFAAWENSIKYSVFEGSNKLSLTLLGGGDFDNPYKIICEAISENIELIVESGLDVYITCFREDDFIEIEKHIINDVYGTNGRVIDTNNDIDCKDLI